MKNKSIITYIVVACIIVILLLIAFFIYRGITSNNSDEVMYSDSVNIEGDEFVEYDDNMKVNNSELLENTKVAEGFEFSNFYIYTIDNTTQIEFDAFNNSENREVLDDFYLDIYDKDGNIYEIQCSSEKFAAQETKRLSITVNGDASNLYDINIIPAYNTVM